MDLVLAKLPQDGNREYLSQCWSAMISRLEYRPLAVSIKLAEREVDRAVEISLAEADAQWVSSQINTASSLDVVRNIAESGRVANELDFQIGTEFLSCVDNSLIHADLYAKIGPILLKYENHKSKK